MATFIDLIMEVHNEMKYILRDSRSIEALTPRGLGPSNLHVTERDVLLSLRALVCPQCIFITQSTRNLGADNPQQTKYQHAISTAMKGDLKVSLMNKISQQDIEKGREIRPKSS